MTFALEWGTIVVWVVRSGTLWGSYKKAWVAACILAAIKLPSGSSLLAAPPSITAEKWLNTLTLRPFDDRRVVVLFVGDKLSRDLKEPIEQLNKLSRRSDLVVLGVTSQREAFARKLIEEYDARFPIGVQSRSARAFDVRKFPAVLVFQRDKGNQLVEPSQFEDILGPAPPEEVPQLVRLSTPELLENLRDVPSPDALEDTLSILRMRLPPDEFLKLCDELEPSRENNPWWKGTVRYARHLADPASPNKQSDSSPGRDAMRKWKRVHGFGDISQEHSELFQSKPQWTTEELLDPYMDHMGSSDEDLVYRWSWAGMIGNLGHPADTNALADMLDMEPDPNVRHRIAAAISDIYDNHPFTDTALVERLERHMEREDNIRWVRPMLELAIHQLKNHDSK